MTGAGRALAPWAGVLFVVSVALAPAAGAESETVSLEGRKFNPSRVEISVGDTVVWKNKGGTHTVTARDGSFDSGECLPGPLGINCLQEGDRFVHEFKKAGVFSYYCRVHENVGMTGDVVVLAGSGVGGGNSSSTTATTQTPASTTTTEVEPPATTTTSRPLTTSSVAGSSTTTTVGVTTTTLTPGEPPVFDPGDADEEGGGANGASQTAGGATASGNDGGSGSGAVAVIVALVLALSAGGFFLWRLRPGRPRGDSGG